MNKEYLLRVYCMFSNYLIKVKANSLDEAKTFARDRHIKNTNISHVFVREEK